MFVTVAETRTSCVPVTVVLLSRSPLYANLV
jgi:hypothetical protein